MLPATQPRGSALAALSAIAEHHGTTRAALRNALAALDIAEQAGRENPVLGQRLFALPVTLVESYGRWRRFDSAAAARAVEEATLGQLSVRGFVAAEKRARPSADSERPFGKILSELTLAGTRYGRVRPSEALRVGMKRLGMLPIAYDLLEIDRGLDPYDRLCGLTARAVVDKARLSHIADQRIAHFASLEHPEADLLLHLNEWRHADDRRIPVLGVMEIEAQSVLERYRLEAKSRYLRAAAAAAAYPAVIVLLPNEEARAATLALCPDLPYDRLGVAPPVLDGERDAASRSPVLYPGRGQGAVVVTSPETIWEDLCRDGAQLQAALTRGRSSR